MKQKSRKYLGFTLIELMTVVVIVGIIMPCIVAVYSFMIKSNREFSLRQTAIQQGYEFFERLNLLMQDYTIDYEEYFNRQMVGCVGTEHRGNGLNGFEWNVGTGGYCTEFTAYGNQNSTNRSIGTAGRILTGDHDIYDCDSETSNDGMEDVPRTVESEYCGKIGTRQSFGQYKSLFIDVHKIGSKDDDQDLGKPLNDTVNAIVDQNNIKELYLISHDGKKRLYFRRKLVNQEGNFVQYRIQMLRLKGFDAGRKHNFNYPSEGFYDGQIDTWACDTSMGFEPKIKNAANCSDSNSNGNSVCGAYSNYYLPQDPDDCWVDLTYGSTSIYTRNLFISPLNDPDLYRIDINHQINPYMKIFLVNGIYSPIAYSGSSITEFKIPIATAINMKDFYRE